MAFDNILLRWIYPYEQRKKEIIEIVDLVTGRSTETLVRCDAAAILRYAAR